MHAPSRPTMKRFFGTLALLAAALAVAEPTPPGKMAFQGYLTDAAGSPLGLANPVQTTVTFRIYRNAAGASAADLVWSEQQVVVVDKGQYTVLLGNGAPVASEPFTNHLASVFTGPDASDRFLGVTVAGQNEIRPRIQFFASPFAQFSGSASVLVSAGGTPLVTSSGGNVGVNVTNAPSVPLEVGGTVKAAAFSGSGAQLTGVSVSAAQITGTITAAQIADGSIAGAKLGAGAIGTDQLADGSVGAAALNASSVATLASQIGGVGSGAIIISSNANDANMTSLGFVNLGPATLDGDRWSVKAYVNAPNAPSPRRTELGMCSDMQLRMSAWTGSKWIVWGGINPAQTANLGDGAIFDPVLCTWTPMSSVNAPSARREFQTAWTGSKFLVWGGFNSATLADGKIYDPAADKWTNMSSTNAPATRTRYSGIWTGTEWIIWGGLTGSSSGYSDGAAYNPATDTWRLLAPGPLAARWDHCAQWTGTEMIIQNGVGASYFQDGARYNPATDTWIPMPFCPIVSSQAASVWTGTEFIIYGGWNGSASVQGGARYNVAANTWKNISAGYSSFVARHKPYTVWTGSEMLLIGGHTGSAGLEDGVRYNPATDTWTLIAYQAGQKVSQFFTWTGSELLYMGYWNDGGNNAVFSYRPPRPAYLYAKP